MEAIDFVKEYRNYIQSEVHDLEIDKNRAEFNHEFLSQQLQRIQEFIDKNPKVETPEQEHTRTLLRGAIEKLGITIRILEAVHGNDPIVSALKQQVFNPLSEVLEKFDKEWYQACHPEEDEEEVDPHIFDDIEA